MFPEARGYNESRPIDTQIWSSLYPLWDDALTVLPVIF